MSLLQGQKSGMEGAEAVNITIGVHFVHFSARLSVLPQASVI